MADGKIIPQRGVFDHPLSHFYEESEEEDGWGNHKPFPTVPMNSWEWNTKLGTRDLVMSMRTKTSPIEEDSKKKGVDTLSFSRSLREIPNFALQRGEPSCRFCSICDDSENLIHSNRCDHWYCRDCIDGYLGEELQENISNVKCPVYKCKIVLDPTFCRQFMPREVLKQWIDALAESSVLAVPMMNRCPFQRCGREFVDDERGFKIIACPYCWRIFCVDCRVGWHMGKSCQQFQIEWRSQWQRARGRRRRRVGDWWPDHGGQKIYLIE